jgi:hypothetical protein
MEQEKKNIDEINFYFSFYEKQNVPYVCKKITFDNKPIISLENSEHQSLSSKVVVINLFPNYLTPDFKKNLYSKKVIHKPGLAIKLNQEFDSIEAYLKALGRSSFRKVVTRSVRRLESCFNIKYNMFYGSISKSECDLLMTRLYY